MRRIVRAEQFQTEPSFTKSSLGEKGFIKGGWVRKLEPVRGDEFQNIKRVFDAVNCLETRTQLAKDIAGMIRSQAMSIERHREYSWLQNWIVGLWGDAESAKISLILLEGYLSGPIASSNDEDNLLRPLIFAFTLASVVPTGDYDGELSRLIFKRFDQALGYYEKDYHDNNRLRFLQEFFPVIGISFLRFSLRLLDSISKPDYEEKEWFAAKRMLQTFYLIFESIDPHSDTFDQFITPVFGKVVTVQGYHMHQKAWPKEESPIKFNLAGNLGQIQMVARLKVNTGSGHQS